MLQIGPFSYTRSPAVLLAFLQFAAILCMRRCDPLTRPRGFVKLQAIFEPPATEMKPLTQDFHGPRAIGFTVVTDGVQAC
jgi:hypothetical protein